MIKATDQKGKSVEIEVSSNTSGTVNGQGKTWDIIELTDGQMHIIMDSKSYNVDVLDFDKSEMTAKIRVNGNNYDLQLEDDHARLLKKLGISNTNSSKKKDLKAPMPGLVIEILVEAGQEVQENDPILILEAMKMENVIKSPTNGTIQSIHIEKSAAVEKNELLIKFD